MEYTILKQQQNSGNNMARPIEHISIVHVPDVEKAYAEWIAPPKPNQAREEMMRLADECAKQYPIKARERGHRQEQ